MYLSAVISKLSITDFAYANLQIHDDFGTLGVFMQDDIWRYIGKLLEIFSQVVVVSIAEVKDYGEPGSRPRPSSLWSGT